MENKNAIEKNLKAESWFFVKTNIVKFFKTYQDKIKVTIIISNIMNNREYSYT